MLPRRRLGLTELEPGIISLGTVKFGRNQSVKYPDSFNLPSNEQLRELLAAARDLGVNLLDTAPAYGFSEERLGDLLRGERQSWIISTKVGEEFEPDKFAQEGRSWFDFSARHTRASIERSMRRLRTDYLDIVLIHSDGNDLDILEQSPVIDSLCRLQQEGWIRAIGISSKTAEGGLKAAELCDLVMVTYNPQNPHEEAVIDRCRDLGKGVLLKKVLASGHICHDAPASGKDALEQALAFALGKPGVTSAVIGTINPAHLRANCLAAMAVLHD
ncbi:aldo/keto reductase [Cellvibrio japonicus]|uniref:Oxidoreductase, aldo/keto reductase family n=1 Tax=Cellvibrio japonicus (strain Ueda107) TaxID=498211 RepID=B3PK84_CELJU|nr:aldo/keto reductase [Cellvibrio japonicus]ACE86071.1 oxidoreductase, aldo/keto reductase family [Cellvibrio japonicus Ueda107]QEI11402.1 aldo/keto reductase [Cellvibrio japonicus]QEI14976.1 aldo/keto reductase [Cellvibrio japonicus]QEI18556.1 aldo/keto reductase [Cellvibrio japonicus]